MLFQRYATASLNDMLVSLENAYPRLLGEVSWVKMGKRKRFVILSFWKYNNLGLTSCESISIKIGCVV